VVQTLDRVLARDELLGRRVELRTIDEDDQTHVAAWAAVRSPYVQLVAALEGTTLVLEHEGSAGTPDAAHLAAALTAIQAAGLVHGAIDAAHVIVAPGRTTLRLPARLAPTGGTSAETDRAALARLLAR
jgi:hypothetical protein